MEETVETIETVDTPEDTESASLVKRFGKKVVIAVAATGAFLTAVAIAKASSNHSEVVDAESTDVTPETNPVEED